MHVFLDYSGAVGPSLASDDELVSDRSLAVLSDVASQIRAGKGISDGRDTVCTMALVVFSFCARLQVTSGCILVWYSQRSRPRLQCLLQRGIYTAS